jgi:hypothetical protein
VGQEVTEARIIDVLIYVTAIGYIALAVALVTL